jgi:hypothetical protein
MFGDRSAAEESRLGTLGSMLEDSKARLEAQVANLISHIVFKVVLQKSIFT